MKRFNTTAECIPSKHYMVDLSERVAEIKKLVDAGSYFTVNRARQYGKTTMLTALRKVLSNQYVVISTSFERIGDAGFASEASFVKEFCRLLRREFWRDDRIPQEIKNDIDELFNLKDTSNLGDLFDILLKWCDISDDPIVMMIDEVDTATNNQVFLDFLAQLRDNYINRDAKGISAFQSVILAGVTDIKSLDTKENSPWNIATDFNVEMSLSESGIKGMLDEYEADHHTGMDTGKIATAIREYTNGYPFLVSRICQLIDESICKFMNPETAWTNYGIDEAVKMILAENNSLFQSLTKNLNNYPELKASIRTILMEGTRLTYNAQQDAIVQMEMYGLIRNDHNTVRIANRIFETMLKNQFLSDKSIP